MVTSTARQKVIELLNRRGAASAAQIGQALSMSAAAVRHHLAILVQDGRIVLEQGRPEGKRGRPEKVYRLSDRLLGENFGALAEALMESWLEALPAEERELALEAVGERIGRQTGSIDANQPAARRLVELTEKLNALGYQARWEAGAKGPRILLGHCPYAAIIGRHPELCSIDAAFLRTLTGADVEQQAKIEARPGGATHCVFAVRPSGAKRAG